MGLFDFVREAGAKVGIGESKADKAAAKATAASAERAAEMAKRVSERKARVAKAQKAEETKKLAADTKAKGLETYIGSLGFEVENLDIRYSDGLATVSGKVKDQQTRERIILAIGNVEDVGQVSDDIEVTDGSEESDMHVVQSGDTLSGIAKKFYGNAGKYPVIFEANRPMLTDPDLIYPGQVLRIPAEA
ncbi:MAG: peptidoglycan-binding protein LysM [Acidimicrobiales bacterium]